MKLPMLGLGVHNLQKLDENKGSTFCNIYKPMLLHATGVKTHDKRVFPH